VKFHDGKPVTAADFQYSWERALNPTTQSQTAGTYLNDIVGADAVLAGQSAHLAGVLLLDSYTLQVNIKTAVTYFLEKMAFPTAFVVEKANVQSGDKWWQHPVGTGPFKLQQWQTDNMVVLQRNEDFHGTKANLSKVVFHLFNGNPMDLYQQGDIDVTLVGSGYMGLVTDPANPISKELHTFPELSVYYIGFNITVPPFDDVKVRQAFCYAVDKERVISLSTKNVVSSAYGVLPPGMPGYNENLRGLHFDPEQAKVLLAASKYSDVTKMPPLVLTTSGWGNDISGIVGGVIAEWRRNLGVEVTVRQLEPDAFLYALAREKDNLFDFGWIADYPDPQDFLDILFRTGAQNNAGSYSNPKLDAILDQASVEPDVNIRYKLYQDAEEMVVQDAAILPVSFAQNYVLVKPYVKDYVLSPLGYPLLGKISIQK
jgi:oligopeptide transport system substrate-binding protein